MPSAEIKKVYEYFSVKSTDTGLFKNILNIYF